MGCLYSKTEPDHEFLTSVKVPIQNILTRFKHLSDYELDQFLFKYQEADLYQLHGLLLEKRIRLAHNNNESYIHMHRANYYFV